MASDLGLQPAASRDEQISDLSGEGSWLACGSVAEAVGGADAALILTEWQEFRQLPWQELAAQMRKPAWLFDARAVTDAQAAASSGLNLWIVGSGHLV